MIITGIGSRETPSDICKLFTEIGAYAKEHGWWIRSGGADGADNAFEQGAQENCIVYLPWQGFNKTRRPKGIERVNDFKKSVFDIVLKYEPYAANLKQSVKNIKSRNVFQILGENLNNPSDIVICWTKNGDTIGGTGLAIKIAQDNNIPILNVGGINRSFSEIVEILDRIDK